MWWCWVVQAVAGVVVLAGASIVWRGGGDEGVVRTTRGSFGANKHSGAGDCILCTVETAALTASNLGEGVLEDSDLGLNWNRHNTGGMIAFMLLTP